MSVVDWSPAHKIRLLERMLETRDKIAAVREQHLQEATREVARLHAAMREMRARVSKATALIESLTAAAAAQRTDEGRS